MRPAAGRGMGHANRPERAARAARGGAKPPGAGGQPPITRNRRNGHTIIRPPAPCRMPIRTYYRLAAVGEGGLLEKNRESYYGVMVGANIASYYESSVASILARLKKPFFVDPCTAPFGLDLGLIKRDGDMRTSYRRLVERMDRGSGAGTLARRIGQGRLRPSDLVAGGGRGRATALAKSLVRGAVDIQKKCLDLDASKKNQSIKRYMEILKGAPQDDVLEGAEFVVAPYFYMPDLESEWLRANAALHAAASGSEEGAYAMICIGRAVLEDAGAAARIAAAYPDAGGFLVWVNAFDDSGANVDGLRRYRTLLGDLAGVGRPIIALYGGYYTAVASERAGIAGLVRGIGSGESRDIERQVGGGGFPKRYYIRHLHSHVMEETAAAALADLPGLRCRCRACKDAMGRAVGRRRPANDRDRYGMLLKAMGPSQIKEHTIHVHRMEARHAAKTGFTASASVLGRLAQADVDRASGLGVRTAHLPRWISALRPGAATAA